MKVIGRGFATHGVVLCLLLMTWACSARTPTSGRSLPGEPQAPQPQTAGVPTPLPAAEEPPPPPESRPPDLPECALTAQTGDAIGTVALSEPVDPANAPRPSNASERLLFRQLYETLLRVDCTGQARPGLAVSWRLDATGRSWIVTLREDASFSDGTPVTAKDVQASWTSAESGELRPDVSRLIHSVVPVGERDLAIELRRSPMGLPMVLAHPDLSVTKPVVNSAWPLGTRASRIDSYTAAQRTAEASVITVARDRQPALRFVVAPGDPRDRLEQGVDLLITRDPATLQYARTLPQFHTLPLPWLRTHVLVTPGRARTSPFFSDDMRQALAEDAVRGEARGAQGPFWWQTLTDCEIASSASATRSSPTPRIVYDAGDAAARDLAERFVGLARASSPGATAFLEVLLPDRPTRTYQRATGLTGEPLALARRLGTDAGYVIAVESRPLDACRSVQTLMDSARWLDPETIVPLVDTRLHAIVKRGRSGLTSEWDGGVLLAAVNGQSQR